MAIMLLWSFSSNAADWPEFLGPRGRGVAMDQAIRTTWSEAEGIAWKAELPGRGASSPIVVGDLVVVTASSGARQDQLHIVALDKATGRTVWHRRLWATGRTLVHPTSAVAAGRRDHTKAFEDTCSRTECRAGSATSEANTRARPR